MDVVVNRFWLRLHHRPRWGSLQHSPRLPSWILGGLLLRGEEMRGGEGALDIFYLPPRFDNPGYGPDIYPFYPAYLIGAKGDGCRLQLDVRNLSLGCAIW